ncbi:MAG TPA: hypothetical protein VFC19_39185 [Candidatus Limnocylindrales bacterium]|nr:hypothetical protein [Candidatus Limnocylindrales bacterium]
MTSLAYIGAWLFHWLIVVIPRKEDRRHILGAAGPLLRQSAGGAQAIVSALENAVQNAKTADPPSADEIRQLCASVNPQSQGPLVLANGTYATWMQYLAYEVAQRDRLHQKLIPAYPYLDAELIELLWKVSEASFAKQVTQINSITIPVANPDLGWLAESLVAYADTCRNVNTYLDQHGK